MLKIHKYIPEIVLILMMLINVQYAYGQENTHAILGWAVATVVEINFLYSKGDKK